ncbi:hypothetical protein MAC_04151 [Metarhizium acridum CQMa 102]|uniref:Uncharacterized protein n=1 Tax=Metarhizium acridum (strain CQMa 102) TaxID=655827 RepID=E9E2Q3_METAQ|nr:uncharacterized protein MAC_04151 [Metarhizium acridum CQMa 102]EFY89719.1 hypothetical protein MAC_04151 [Metarhizium acridum CQMa 102]
MGGPICQEIRKFGCGHTADYHHPCNKFPEHGKEGRSSRLSQRLQGFFSRRPKVCKDRRFSQDCVKCEESSDSDASSASGPADAAADVKDHHVSNANHDNCSPQDTREDEKQQPLTVRVSAGLDKTLAELNPTIRAVRDSSASDESLLPVDSITSSGTQFASESLDDRDIVQPGLSSKCENHPITKGKLKPPPVQFKFLGEESRKWELFWKKRTPSSESMVCETALRREEIGAMF